MFSVYFKCILGFVDVEDMIFDRSDDDNDEIKWNLLLWSLGLDPQMQFGLQKIPRKYMPTVLALKFLCNVKSTRTKLKNETFMKYVVYSE